MWICARPLQRSFCVSFSVGESKVKTNMIKVIKVASGSERLENRNQSAPETEIF